MVEYQTTPNKDPYANLIMQAFITNATIGVFINMVYLKPEVAPAAFDPFYSIAAFMDTTKIQTLTEFISGQIVPTIPRYATPHSYPEHPLTDTIAMLCRFDWLTTTLEPTLSLFPRISNVLDTAPEVQSVTAATAGSLALAIQPISSNVVQEGIRRGGNALGLQATPQQWFTLDIAHWFAADDESVHDATKGVLERIEDVTKEEGVYLPYQFMNDASYDQDVIGHYGSENVDKLWAVSEKYDPEGVFQRLVPGGFKLP